MKRQNIYKIITILVCMVPALLAMAIDQDRDKWQQPDKVLKLIGIQPGMHIGEPGAGRGYYTFRLAKLVGNTGKIYANDIKESDLEIIKKKAQEEEITNIIIIKGQIEDPLFPPQKLDMIFMSYVLHDLERPVPFLNNMKPSLKPGAPLIILEQAPEKTGNNHFWKQEKILETVKEAGFRLEKIESFLEKDNIYFFYLN